MIVVGGIQYMGDESIFGKTEGKKKIWAAILGLLIALGSYALLKTINPDLLGGKGLNVQQVSAEIINLPDVGDKTIDPNFSKGGGPYSLGSVSSGTTNAILKLQNGWQISSFVISSNNNNMTISLTNGTASDNSNSIPILPGTGGYAGIGQGTVGDSKTPKGNWKILEIRNAKQGNSVYSKTGSNMGASFWLLNPMTTGERGIGMHGNISGTLSATNGCVRLINADLLALLPYVKTGIPVVIQ
jgi:lipoprotein-anchoring transpeptidase ErfK/SrfK